MEPQDFKRWRKALDWSQKQAAEALGLKRRVVQYYEKGERDGEAVSVPKSVRLACYALWVGIRDFHGPVQVERKGAEPGSEPVKGKIKAGGGKAGKGKKARKD